MANPPPPRNYTKRVSDWALLQLASSGDACDVVRLYDRRYQQADLTHQRVQAEAQRAAELAREYTAAPPGAANAAPRFEPGRSVG
jgi:hypothetical protein